MRLFATTLGLFLVALGGSLAHAAPRVSLEVATAEGLPITAQQKWLRLLSGVGFDGLRVRSARPGDQAAIENFGTDERPSYKVTGILNVQQQLVLKGGTFAASDLAGLKAWLGKLQTEGIAGLTHKKGAFGLTTPQLIETLKKLEPPVAIATKGEPPANVIQKITDRLDLSFTVDAAAAQALGRAEPCYDEVQGISAGTALAALLRPYGLVLQPHRPAGGAVRMVIAPATRDSEPWPIGWPPEKRERELMPALYEFLNAEIADDLTRVLDVLQKRLKTPFLYDHNSLAAQRIDLEAIEVKLPAGRTYYKKILDRVLFQAKLKTEIRIDEAGRPIVWITTLRRG